MDINLIVGRNIRKHRKELHMTQKQLADKAYCHQSLISEAETGKTQISLTTLVSVADALGVPAYVLLAAD